jgi:WD40 repeat protein
VNPNDEVNVVIATETFLLQHYKFNDNYTTKELIRSIKGHNMPILCMAYDATGTLVATGCADRNVRVFDIDKGYCTHNYKEHNDIVRSGWLLTHSFTYVLTHSLTCSNVSNCFIIGQSTYPLLMQ